MKKKSCILTLMIVLSTLLFSTVAFADYYSEESAARQKIASDPANSSYYANYADLQSRYNKSDIVFFVDGNLIDTSLSGCGGTTVSAQVQYHKPYIPIRSIVDTLAKICPGSSITYTSSTGDVDIWFRGRHIVIENKQGLLNVNQVKIDGNVRTLSSPIIGQNWRYIVPADFISDCLSLQTDYTGTVVWVLVNNNSSCSTNPGSIVSNYTAGTTYNNPINLTLSCSNSTEIRYTTDGSTPSKCSNYYNGCIPINTTTTINARGYNGNTAGPVFTCTYIINVNNNIPGSVIPNYSTGTTYNSPINLTLSCSNSTEIRYTTDGSIPSKCSNYYNGCIPISTTTTINARGYYGDTAGSVFTGTYTIGTTSQKPSRPYASPAGSTYYAMPLVSLCSPDGGDIYYTLDGSTPSTGNSSQRYTGSFYIDKNVTLNAIVYKNGLTSDVYTQTYVLPNVPSAPSFSPYGGNITRGSQVTIYSNTSGGIIRYTTDGSEPFLSSGTAQTYSYPITIDRNMTIRARVYTADQNNRSAVVDTSYTVNDSQSTQISTLYMTPYASPSGTTFTNSQTVSIYSNTNDGSQIYYTLDGSYPTVGSSSTRCYSGAFTIYNDTTVNAVAYKNGQYSSVVAGRYIISNYSGTQQGLNIYPYASASGTNFTGSQTISMYTNDGSQIYYTTNGTTPTIGVSGTKIYTGSFTISSSTVVKARTYLNGQYGTLVQANYIIQGGFTNAAPWFSETTGFVNYGTKVYIYTDIIDGVIRYTTDGNDPTIYSSIYYSQNPIIINSTTTIKARVYSNNGSDKTNIAVAYYYINPNDDNILNTPTANITGGTYNNPQTVYLYTTNSDAVIRYTTDGSDPSVYSTKYSGSIYVNRTLTIKAKAFRGDSSSAILTINVTINSSTSSYNPPPAAYQETMSDEERDLLSQAWARYNVKDYDGAISILNQLLNEYADCDEGIVLKANCYVNKNQTNTAKSILKDFLDEYDYPLAVNRYAELISGSGQNTQAQSLLINAISEYSDQDYLYRTLANINEKLGYKDIKVFIRGTEVNFASYDNVKPIIENGTVLIPIRAFSESLGATVNWDEYSRKATINYNGNTIVLTENNVNALVNGSTIELTVPARNLNGRELIPLRFVIENFGEDVDWFQSGLSRIAVVY